MEPGGGGSSGGGGRMSAEAADREAATSSRPCTPPQTCWFEFLLEESLLEKHLRKACPGERASERAGGRGLRPAAFCPPLPEAWPAPLGPARRCLSRERRRGASAESFRQRLSVCRGPHSEGRPHSPCGGRVADVARPWG